MTIGKKIKKPAFYMALFLCFTLCISLFITPAKSSQNSGRIDAYSDLIRNTHYEYIPIETEFKKLVMGSFRNTDPYTYFQEHQTYQSQREEYIDARYEGIGVSMSLVEEGARVENVFLNSPAYDVGLVPGDRLVSADGVSLRGRSLEYMASRIRGPKNTTVRIGVRKGGVGEVVYIDIERRSVAITSVLMFATDDVAYINLSSFTNETPNEFQQALNQMELLGMNKMILDLRDNGGGSVFGALNIANKLLSDELITKIYYKNPGYLNIAYRADEKELDYEIVLLINGRSASAAEIVAGALKDHERAVLIGEQSYGKSLIQSSFELLTPSAYDKYVQRFGVTDMIALQNVLMMNDVTVPDHEKYGAAKITIGEYRTPNDHQINQIGIAPHIAIENTGATILRSTVNKPLYLLDRYQKDMENAEIQKAKIILSQLGYDLDVTDGTFDDQMKKAVTQFQQDQGLHPYGILDYTTQKALNGMVIQEIIGTDNQLEEAFRYMREEH